MTADQIVPCNGCRACCIGDLVRLLACDDVTRYETEPHPYVAGALMLAHKRNGECVYLGDSGCTIHPYRPQQCREMDCRNIAAAFTYTRARKMPGLRMQVWRRGRELLRERARAGGRP